MEKLHLEDNGLIRIKILGNPGPRTTYEVESLPLNIAEVIINSLDKGYKVEFSKVKQPQRFKPKEN